MCLTFVNEDGDDVQIPARYEVCDRCRGKGTHVNPAVDGNGITGEEMDELGEDFREDYLGGVYDVRCSECEGERVVLVVDESLASAELLEQYWTWQADEASYRRECEMERRMGA